MSRPDRAEVTVETNEAERRRWNDARWAGVWPKRERLTDEVTEFVLAAAALSPGERVLDVGCGGGKASLAAARAVGDEGEVVGADLSGPLVALAERRAHEVGASNVSFQVLDMQTDDVAGVPFDVVLSQFGVMFFDEPVTAFTRIRAQLAPGGRIAFACWQESEKNPWIFTSAIAELVPRPPAPAPGKSPTGPFALADPVRTAGILRTAGFVAICRTPQEISVDVPPDTVFDDDQLSSMGIADADLAAAEAAVAAHLRQFALSDTLSRFPLAFQVFEASNPASR